MKRGAVNSRQFCGSMENSKLSNKYNALLEDYLELQKVGVLFCFLLLMIIVVRN